jgi:flagellar motility protein MotE (MotC chaperone)
MDLEKLKKDHIVRALRVSPSNEKVVLYEQGKASDIATKLAQMKTQQVVVLVLK